MGRAAAKTSGFKAYYKEICEANPEQEKTKEFKSEAYDQYVMTTPKRDLTLCEQGRKMRLEKLSKLMPKKLRVAPA